MVYVILTWGADDFRDLMVLDDYCGDSMLFIDFENAMHYARKHIKEQNYKVVSIGYDTDE